MASLGLRELLPAILYVLEYLDGAYDGCSVHLLMFLLFSSGVLHGTPFHMWGKLCLTMFLLRVGLFTLTKMDSFIVPAKSCPSLATMLNLSSVVEWWPHIGEGASRCSLNLSPNVLADSPMYSPSKSSLLHLYNILSQFLFYLVLILRCYKKVLEHSVPLNISGCHMYHKFS